MDIEKLKDTIQDCNINFLLGSGLSRPFLPTLGNIEVLLTELDGCALGPTDKKIVRVSLYKQYFDSVISKNLSILGDDAAAKSVLDEYKTLLRCLHSLLMKRKTTILTKEINLFTTNIDIFLDKALEQLNLEYNDGFNGRFRPVFSLSNFKTSRFKKSLYYDKTAELTVFNLLKLHGSLSWRTDGDGPLVFSNDLQHIHEVARKIPPADHVVDVPDNASIASLTTSLAGKTADTASDEFMVTYEKLLIVVNPTKDKFRQTVMNQTYHELLRLYSNELEKENTVLFAMGFSFADEHIREITIRCANSNPTLMVYVFAHTSKSKATIQAGFGGPAVKNSNVEVIGPTQEDDGHGHLVDKFNYDFPTINKEVFASILSSVDTDN